MVGIDKIVEDMIKQHKGGERFFDHLDDIVKNNQSITDMLITLAEHHSGLPSKDMNIIVSGEFGRLFSNNYQKKFNTLLVVKGGLRKNIQIDDLSFTDIKNKEFIFFDDSFYSGKTRNAIENELVKNGAALQCSAVAYDGSKNKDCKVHSLYRYYDNYTDI